MSVKRPRSPSLLSGHPVIKRRLLNNQITQNTVTFDSLSALGLADELVLVVFGFLDAVDLCRVEGVNKAWQRVAGDNELWKALFLRAFGRSRLRGTRFSFGGIGRAIVPLKGHVQPGIRPPNSSWKEMYRVGRNWQTGRSVADVVYTFSPPDAGSLSKPLVLLTGRSATIVSDGHMEVCPNVKISAPQRQQQGVPMILTSSKRASNAPLHITSLALNQAPSDVSISLAVFYSTATNLHHISIFNVASDLKSSRETSITTSRTPRSPTQQSVYHSNLLIALSESFQLDIYHIPSPDGKPTLQSTLSSFSSFPPASLRISRPTNSIATHKILLSYAVPIYPAHWSVATTELLLNAPASAQAMPNSVDIVNTRTLRVFHSGWQIINADDDGSGLPVQGGTTELAIQPINGSVRIPAVAAVQTDGRHLVIVPAGETYMLLYRVRQASLAFLRVLFGPKEPVLAIAVADARCVAVSKAGEVWVFDLDADCGVEVEKEAQEMICLTQRDGGGKGGDLQGPIEICFDDRQIVVSTPIGLRTISFD